MLVVYDLTQKESFEGVRFWINEVSDKAEEEVAIVMTANKCDLIDKRALSLNDGEEFAKVPSNILTSRNTTFLSEKQVPKRAKGLTRFLMCF